MDISVIIGFVSGVALICYGILGSGTLMNFWDPASIAITLGGVICSTIISYPFSAWKDVPKHMKILFGGSKYNPNDYIAKIVDYAVEARRKGLLALENKAEQEEDNFLKSCILLIVDAIEPEKARDILENEIDCLEARHSQGWGLYEKMATFAPAFGMIGTLIGLINMLMNMGDMTSGDAASGLGAGMSVALITTFYGSVLANFIFMPICNKLRNKHNDEILCKQLTVDGILDIHAGTNPRHIEEKLKAYVADYQRVNFGEGGEGGEGKKGKKKKK